MLPDIPFRGWVVVVVYGEPLVCQGGRQTRHRDGPHAPAVDEENGLCLLFARRRDRFELVKPVSALKIVCQNMQQEKAPFVQVLFL